MIRGIISEGMQLAMIGTDGTNYYRLAKSGDQIAFGSFGVTAPTDVIPQIAEANLLNPGTGSNRFYITRRDPLVEYEQANDIFLGNTTNGVGLTANYNLPLDGLYAGALYTADQSVECWQLINPALIYGGVDLTLPVVKLDLKFIFVPITTAISKYNFGVCTLSTVSTQALDAVLMAIDMSGPSPVNCDSLDVTSQNCYTMGSTCFGINYCSIGQFCESGCYGNTQNQEVVCVMRDNSVSLQPKTNGVDLLPVLTVTKTQQSTVNPITEFEQQSKQLASNKKLASKQPSSGSRTVFVVILLVFVIFGVILFLMERRKSHK